jgi:hypothetical protein
VGRGARGARLLAMLGGVMRRGARGMHVFLLASLCLNALLLLRPFSPSSSSSTGNGEKSIADYAARVQNLAFNRMSAEELRNVQVREERQRKRLCFSFSLFSRDFLKGHLNTIGIGKMMPCECAVLCCFFSFVHCHGRRNNEQRTPLSVFSPAILSPSPSLSLARCVITMNGDALGLL